VATLARQARDAEEWQERFAREFRGRSVVFINVPVGRDRRGRPTLPLRTYDVEADDEFARVALEDLDVLRDLPLDDSPRLVFGARLLSCEREAGGELVIRLEPDSGVLLTDLEAVVAAEVQAPDEGLRRAIARQKKWLEERAAVEPARP